MHYKRYEWAMFNQLYYDFRPPNFIVEPDFREIIGKLSGEKRQIDVIVHSSDDLTRPFLIVECKCHGRKLDMNVVEAFISKVQDIKPRNSILVAPNGFTSGAEKRAKPEGIPLVTLSIPDAERLNYRDIIHEIFPWDEICHPQMGDALYQFKTSENVISWIDSLEGLMFEEWERQIYYYYTEDDRRCIKLLRKISMIHYDDGWRFNAIRLLKDFGDFDEDLRITLNSIEDDPDCLKLINNGF